MHRNFTSLDWFTLSVVIFLIGLFILKQINTIRFAKFFKLGYTDVFFQNKQNDLKFISSFEVVLFIIVHLIISQFLFLKTDIKSHFSVLIEDDYLKFLLLFFTLTLFTLLKYKLENYVNILMDSSSFLSFYIFYKQIIWSYALILGLPFIIIGAYFPFKSFNYLEVSFVIMGTYYVIKMLLFLYKKRNIIMSHWYYFILYFCTLEIAPYYFIYKIFAME